MERRYFVMLILLAGLALPMSALAADQEIAREDQAAITEAVQSQLIAVANDDADAAFALATADTRSRMGDANTFLQLIKQQYAPLYRHQRAIFSTPEMIHGETIQSVRLTDSDNSVWVALYQMQQEPDGKWRIAGCTLLETTTVSV